MLVDCCETKTFDVRVGISVYHMIYYIDLNLVPLSESSCIQYFIVMGMCAVSQGNYEGLSLSAGSSIRNIMGVKVILEYLF